jgi:phage terminase small subunit
MTNKQRKFVSEYIKDCNATQAAIRAGYVPKMASKLVAKSCIMDAIRKKLAKFDVNAEKVIAEFAKIAFSNVGDFIEEGNEIKDLSKLSRDKLATVESIQSDIRHDGGDSQGYTEKVKLKFHSKVSALENLGKHLGIYAADNKFGVTVEILPPVIK